MTCQHTFIEAPLRTVILYSCTNCDAVFVVTPTGVYEGQ
jgi:hypothetical protein